MRHELHCPKTRNLWYEGTEMQQSMFSTRNRAHWDESVCINTGTRKYFQQFEHSVCFVCGERSSGGFTEQHLN